MTASDIDLKRAYVESDQCMVNAHRLQLQLVKNLNSEWLHLVSDGKQTQQKHRNNKHVTIATRLPCIEKSLEMGY